MGRCKNRIWLACACIMALGVTGCGSASNGEMELSTQKYAEIIRRYPPGKPRRVAFHAAIEADIDARGAGVDPDTFLRALGRSFALAHVEHVRGEFLNGDITANQARDAIQNALLGTEPPFPFMQGALGPLSGGLQWIESHGSAR